MNLQQPQPARPENGAAGKLFAVLLLLGLAWLFSLRGLMITDIWDETNLLLALRSPTFAGLGVGKLIAYVWTHEVSFYRPLATSVLICVEELGGTDFRYLRYANALLVLASVLLFSRILFERFEVSAARVVAFAALALGSSAALITASWFANVFDATCLFLLALGYFLVFRDRFFAGGIVIGTAFFCKEIAILGIPFLLFGYISGKYSARSLAKIAGPALALAGVYLFMRQSVVEFGSSSDIHPFVPSVFIPSLVAFLKSFWWQHTKFPSHGAMGIAGLVLLGLTILSIRNHRSQALAIAIVLIASVAYWGMFGYQDKMVVTSFNFIGRLYLIPSILILFLLAVDSDWRIFPLLLVPLLAGAMASYADHSAFQRLYLDMYREAAAGPGTLRVHYPDKQLDDPARRLRVGDDPSASITIDRMRATLAPNRLAITAGGR